MITDKHKRKQLQKRVENLSSDKIDKLLQFMDNLEKETSNKKKIMSYAGAWSDLDDEVIKDLTENLVVNRKKNKRKFAD